jgi:hypothetical protein
MMQRKNLDDKSQNNQLKTGGCGSGSKESMGLWCDMLEHRHGGDNITSFLGERN